jgi:hypothetical protein
MSLFSAHCSGVYCCPDRVGTTLFLVLCWDIMSRAGLQITQCQNSCSEAMCRWDGEVETEAEEKVEVEAEFW